jgi:hypothetical protein
MKISNPTMHICFLYGIVGVTSVNPISVPLVQSLGDLSLKRALLMLISVKHIFAHQLKFDGIGSLHLHAPYHVHHECTIT